MPDPIPLKITGIEAPLMNHEDALTWIDEKVISTLKREKPDFLLLPEKWIMQKYELNGADLDSVIDRFCRISDDFKTTIVPGSFSLSRDSKLFNSSPVIADGEVLGWQDKISLYRFERGVYSPGNEIRTFRSGKTTFSVAVCYDLDFPYFGKEAINKGARLLFNPSLIKKEYHEMWHIYVRGRSLENRIPVLSVNSATEPLSGGSIGTYMEEKEDGIILKSAEADEQSISYSVDYSGTAKIIEKRLAEDPGRYTLGNADEN